MNRKSVASLFITIVLAAALAGCAKKPAAPQASRDVLGTKVTITLYDAAVKAKDAQPIFDAAFALLAEWEAKTMSATDANQVAAISGGAGNQSVPTDPPVHELLMKALRLYDNSGQVFDIRYGPFLDLWGFGATPRVPTQTELDTAKSLVAEGGMFVAGNSILLAKKGMRFDVREIAVGHAFDLAAARLAEAGIQSAMIAAPDIWRMMGNAPDPRGFKAEVPHPLTGAAGWATVWLPVGGAAVAGQFKNAFQSGGAQYHSFLDPRTGRPARACAAALVETPDAATAQALAYASFVFGNVDSLAAAGKRDVNGSVIVKETGGNLDAKAAGSLSDRFELHP